MITDPYLRWCVAFALVWAGMLAGVGVAWLVGW
jgi:hypothetical protein